ILLKAVLLILPREQQSQSHHESSCGSVSLFSKGNNSHNHITKVAVAQSLLILPRERQSHRESTCGSKLSWLIFGWRGRRSTVSVRKVSKIKVCVSKVM